ncbi:MAG TPA: DUF2975 domain-containing protein [Steroidobacteraceae bacterium]|nr:DUF2975 domain-containing protein [Steroidobacteraceae bacterium]
MLVPAAEIVVVLFCFHQSGAVRAFVSFGGWGVGLTIGGIGPYSHNPAFVALNSLDLQLRLTVAVLAALCAAGSILVLVQLRALFSLYSRGVVFAADNVARMKKFGLWLVVTAIVVNVSGRLFARALGAPAEATANAAMTVIYGVMIYVIAHVMALAREADLERKEFV